MKSLIHIAILLLISTPMLTAHGDLDLRIETVTADINMYPDSAALYFVRGKLKYQHEEYQAAIDDITTSVTKGHLDEFQNIYLAKSYYELDKPSYALTHINDFLSLNDKNVAGLKIKARILSRQNKFEASALCFEKVIALSIRTLPENYLEAAQAWSSSTLPDKHNKIIGVLRLGINNLGPIVTLQNQLIEEYLSAGHSDQAIAQQQNIIDKTNRKEVAYFKLAEIYLSINDNDSALPALVNAQAYWNKLPFRIKKNPAMIALKADLEQMIATLDKRG